MNKRNRFALSFFFVIILLVVFFAGILQGYKMVREKADEAYLDGKQACLETLCDEVPSVTYGNITIDYIT